MLVFFQTRLGKTLIRKKPSITKESNFEQQNVGNKAKGRISERVFQENKACQIFRKTNISHPVILPRTCRYQGVRNIHFPGKFSVLCFLETPVLIFALLLYYRRHHQGIQFLVFLWILKDFWEIMSLADKYI